MKNTLIVANWKSNKTESEALEWLNEYPISRPKDDRPLAENNKEIIICPSFTLLPVLNKLIKENKLPFKLGAQDISAFEEGAYTGEVNARQVKEFVNYAIIGHSERRINLKEDDETLKKKVEKAVQFGIKPIYCVQDEKTTIPEGVGIVAYEPIFAIGSGSPDTPQNAERVALFIKEKTQVSFVLYGGSVTPENVKIFTQLDNIDGVLVGSSSLEADKFTQLLNAL